MRSGIPQAVETRELVTETSKPWSVQAALAGVPVSLSPPGKTFDYNNANYWLLGLVIEKVRGVRVGQALAQDLFEPQRLSRITLQSEQPLAPPLARPGDDSPDIPIPAAPDGYLPFRSLATYVGAAAAIASDAPTVARWGNQLYGGHVLADATLREMLDVSDGDRYGLGFADFSDESWNVAGGGHEGEQLGYRAVLISMEQPQLTVALLTPSRTDLSSYVQYLVKAGNLLT